MNIKILTLDQSTKVTGFSVFKESKLDQYGLLTVNKNEKNAIERMKLMSGEIRQLINTIKPDYIVFENVQFQRNYKTYQQLSQLQGVLMALLFEIDIGFTIIEPSAWKSSCEIKGKKRAEQKENTQIFVKNKFGIDVSEDEADAIGIGVWATKNIKRMKGIDSI